MSKGIQNLIDLNKEHSRLFSDPGTAAARRQYRAQHPTEIGSLKCMDGRLHLPVATKTPLGIIQPWRNVGGKFDIGWPAFSPALQEWRDYALSKGRNALLLVTYHYSRGEKHRGCRGFNYDTEAAIAYTADLKKHCDLILGRPTAYAIQIGFETDWDALILHGENGEVVDVSTLTDVSDDAVFAMLRRLYPEMPERIIKDFMPLIQGNVEHIAEMKKIDRTLDDVDHRESVLAIGRGFDWLHVINKALIIGPFDPDFDQAVAVAANIILNNLKAGRIDQEDIVLLASSPYRHALDKPFKQAKSEFLHRYAMDVIRQQVPEIIPHLQYMTAVVNIHTREMEVMDSGRA